MARAATLVIGTVNAPYGVLVTAEQLAAKLTSSKSVEERDPSVFAFLSEVSFKLQNEFIEEMNLNKNKVTLIADAFSEMVGYSLPLSSK